MNFSERLALIMQAYKLTAIRIARYCRLLFKERAFNSNTVYSWLKDKRQPMSEHLRQLGIMFGVSVDWLLGLGSNMYSEEIISRFEADSLAKCIWFRYEEIMVELPYKVDWQRVAELNPDAKGQLYFLLANVCLEFRNYLVCKSSFIKFSEEKVVVLFRNFIRNRGLMREYISRIRFIAASGGTCYTLSRTEAGYE